MIKVLCVLDTLTKVAAVGANFTTIAGFIVIVIIFFKNVPTKKNFYFDIFITGAEKRKGDLIFAKADFTIINTTKNFICLNNLTYTYEGRISPMPIFKAKEEVNLLTHENIFTDIQIQPLQSITRSVLFIFKRNECKKDLLVTITARSTSKTFIRTVRLDLESVI